MDVREKGNALKIVILSGPSGSGKGTVITALGNRYQKAISVTTRDIRVNEVRDVDYCFITQEEFFSLQNEGNILEYTYFDDHYYGTPRPQIDSILAQGKNVILDVDVYGALNIKREYPQALMVFLMSPNAAVQEKRLRCRGTNSELSIKKRICTAKIELTYADKFECIIINEENKLEETVSKLKNYIENGICDNMGTEKFIQSYFDGYEL